MVPRENNFYRFYVKIIENTVLYYCSHSLWLSTMTDMSWYFRYISKIWWSFCYFQHFLRKYHISDIYRTYHDFLSIFSILSSKILTISKMSWYIRYISEISYVQKNTENMENIMIFPIYIEHIMIFFRYFQIFSEQNIENIENSHDDIMIFCRKYWKYRNKRHDIFDTYRK